jgi:carbon monoxide dehydrogenase subunit G
MTTFSTTVNIHAAPKRVWAVLTDVEHWHEWTASITSIERLDSGPLAVGSRARVRQPRLLTAIWQVTELKAGRAFTWATRSPGMYTTGRHDIEESGDGSRVTLSTHVSGLFGTLVAALTRDLIQRYVTLEAQGLKARSEGVTATMAAQS